MSILFTENQGYNTTMNSELCSNSQSDNDSSWYIGPPQTAVAPAAAAAPVLSTPPPKRRRGRPPKIIEEVDGQPSPAANLSAAVLKQGTPKFSAPLMRISPTANRRPSKSSISSSPFQTMKINPSPKGGMLMNLSEEAMDSSSTKQKKKPKVKRKNVKEDGLISKTRGISLSSQQKLQSIVKESLGSNPYDDVSVNPSLLLSSPILSSNKVKLGQLKIAESKRSNRNSHQFASASIDLSSSPLTPNSITSSHFSSVIQSSPLYHGYYVNQSSPNTTIYHSSPVKYQMKPIEDFKRSFAELPKNPDNSPSHSRATTPSPTSKKFNSKIQKPQSSQHSMKLPSPIRDEQNYKITLSIDETGQAKITKTIPSATPKAATMIEVPSKKPAFTRHRSLMDMHHSSHAVHTQPTLQRSQSTTKVPSSDNYEMFFEPLKMSNDPFFNEVSAIGENVHSFESTNFDVFNEENLVFTSDENIDELRDEDMNFDARKALLRMIRHSV